MEERRPRWWIKTPPELKFLHSLGKKVRNGAQALNSHFVIEGALFGEGGCWSLGWWGFYFHQVIAALLPLTHVIEVLPEGLHPAAQIVPTLGFGCVSQFFTAVAVSDGQGVDQTLTLTV